MKVKLKADSSVQIHMLNCAVYNIGIYHNYDTDETQINVLQEWPLNNL